MGFARVGGVALVLAAAGFGGWWLLRGGALAGAPGPETVAEVSESGTEEASELPATPPPEQEDAATAGSEESGARAAVAEAVLSLRVLTDAGEPLEGATVTWDLLRQEVSPGAPPIEWEPIPAGQQANSDALGLVRFAQPPGGSAGGRSVLWVTAPGWRAKGLLVEPGEGGNLGDVELEPGGVIAVRVEDGTGRPVAGARVRAAADLVASEARPHQGRRWLRREVRTDAGGRCQVPDLAGTLWIVATADERSAPPWRGEAPCRLVLVLRETFRVSGEVIGLAPDDPAADGLRVRVFAESGPFSRSLGELPVEEGRFGPAEIARIEGARYAFELSGPLVAPVTEWVETPRAGEHVRLRLEAESSGMATGAIVQDPEGAPIEGATVEVQQRVGGEWIWAQGRTDAEGRCELRNVRRGNAWVSARKHGFVQLGPPIAVFVERPDVPDPAIIVLHPARTLRGFVLHDGQPVQNFRVCYTIRDSGPSNSRNFADREDGSFTLNEVPNGKISVQAGAPGFPPSEAIVVDTAARDEDEPVVLELREGGTARGQILDLWSGEPIAGARIELWSTLDGYPATNWGIQATSRSDGWFEISPVRGGEAVLTVKASGYADGRIAIPALAAGETVDLGVTRLDKTRTLVVRVVADGIEDYSGYRISMRGSFSFPLEHLPPDGVRVCEGLTTGPYVFRVASPDWQFVEKNIQVGPGYPGEVRIRAPSARAGELEVLVTPPPPESLEGLGWVGMISLSGQETWYQNKFIPEDGRLTLHGPFAETFSLVVVDRIGAYRALRILTRDDVGKGTVRLEVGSNPWTVKVIDVEDRPVPGAFVMVSLPGNKTGWSDNVYAEDAGRARFPSVPPDEPLVLWVDGFGSGSRPEILVPPEERGREDYVVRVGEGIAASILVHDGSLPLEGAMLLLKSKDTSFIVSQAPSTGADGRTQTAPTPPGTYIIEARAEHAWPARKKIEITTQHQQFEIEVRRLGSLAIFVRAASGALVPGAAIALESLETGESVAQWIADGKVEAPPGGLVSGPDGRCLVTAIPNGPYRWRVQAPDGNWIEGQVSVPPLEVGELVVHLP